MSDITNTHLDAALLDQKVAGEFAGLRYAFTVVLAKGGGWRLGVAVADEPGYSPIHGKVFSDHEEAAEWANSLNQHIGLDREAALTIVCSTLRRRTNGR